MVKLLYLSPFPSRPLYGGAVVRNHYLARSLARRHQVWASFVGLDGGPEFAAELPLRREGLPALFDPAFLSQARALVLREGVEAIVSSSLIAGLHGALLKLLTGRRFWMDEHNVEWHCARRYGHRFWWLIYLLEGFILRSADHVTCVSQEDRERLIRSFRLSPSRVTVAPNGVETEALRERARTVPQRTSKRVLFFGVLNYPPNREAVEILGQEIAPRLSPEVEVVVAGRGGEDLAARFPNLNFVGFVPDIHELIRECDGLLVPILAGGGTRMKILETLCCGRPVISTSCGAEGLDRSVIGPALELTEDWERMARWVDELVVGSSIELPESFAELYDWEKIWQNGAPL